MGEYKMKLIFVLAALQVALACQNLKKTFKVDEKSLAYKNPKTKKVIPKFVKQSKKAAKNLKARPGRLVVVEYDKKTKKLFFTNLHILGVRKTFEKLEKELVKAFEKSTDSKKEVTEAKCPICKPPEPPKCPPNTCP